MLWRDLSRKTCRGRYCEIAAHEGGTTKVAMSLFVLPGEKDEGRFYLLKILFSHKIEQVTS